MELKDVQDYIKTNAEKPEVKSYIKGFDKLTPDGVKAYIETEDGMKLIQPKLDSHFTKSLETWKTNNLDTLVGEKVDVIVKEKYPTETEGDKRLKQLEDNLTKETGLRRKAELLNSATADASARGLPPDLVKYFIGNDEESTKAALLAYDEKWKAAMKTETDKIFKQYGRTPEPGQSPEDLGLYSEAQVKKMTQTEVSENYDKVLKSQASW